jgi:speckle-type POZ protein
MAPVIPTCRRIASDDRVPSVSASAIVGGSASGYHVLGIRGYSSIKVAFPNGKHFDSLPFRVAGHTWFIRYFPNGDSPETADHISLYLHLKDQLERGDELMVQFMISFMDQVEKQKPAFVGSLEARRFGTNGWWGYKEFIKKESLEQSERLKDDCFSIRCDIIVTGLPRAEAAAAFAVAVPPLELPQHFSALLLGGKGADVRFLVGDKTFAAHRCVLAARSPVFDALLFGPMKEGTSTENRIRIDDMAAQVFRTLLHFIYTDSLPETIEQDNGGATMAQHLLEAADRYDLQRLKLICEDRLCQQIDVSTVATTLALAEQHHCQALKEACFEFLKSPKTLDEVSATDGFQHLVKTCPSALFQLMSKLGER